MKISGYGSIGSGQQGEETWVKPRRTGAFPDILGAAESREIPLRNTTRLRPPAISPPPPSVTCWPCRKYPEEELRRRDQLGEAGQRNAR